MTRKSIILVGGGGHCHSVIDVLEKLRWPIHGIIDSKLPIGSKVMNVPVIGTDQDIPLLLEHPFLVTVGQIKTPDVRIRLHHQILNAGGELATVISPLAHVSKWAMISPGTVVMNFANVNANALIGMGCIINTMADIEHDANIGNFCHISTGAIVNGVATVGAESFIGSHATIFQNAHVPERSVISAGAIVRK
ncbi:MAG: acetyltransferase [Bacteroidales bacterium]|nr:acetyltransferase [Bacteroidales bacterium]